MEKSFYLSSNRKNRILASTLVLVFVCVFVLNFSMSFATTPPAITSATYNVGTGVLVLTGTDFVAVTGGTNDIDPTKFRFTDKNLNAYSLSKYTSSVEITSATAATITVSERERGNLATWMDAEGTTTAAGDTYKIIANEGWNGDTSTGDMHGATVTVSGIATLTSAALDMTAGTLVLTGEELVANSRGDISPDKITISNGLNMYSFLSKKAVELDSATQATITLDRKDSVALTTIIDANGTLSRAGRPYNIVVEDGWNGDTSIADVGTNALTVTNYTAPVATVTTTTIDINRPVRASSSKDSGYLYLIPANTSLVDAKKSTLDALVTAGTATVADVKRAGSFVTIRTNDLTLTGGSVDYGVVAVDGSNALSAISSGVVTIRNSDAPQLTAVAAAGTSAGTKVTVTPEGTNTLAYKISSTSITKPKLLDASTGTTTYTSGNDISGVDATTNKYLGIYELDTNSKIVKFKELIMTSTVLAVDSTGPVISSTAVNSTKKIVTITFDEAISNNTASSALLKAGVTYANDGTTFVALQSSDTVAISGNDLVVTFNSALSDANDKIRVAADTLKDTSSNENLEATSSAILAGWSSTNTLSTDNPEADATFTLDLTTVKVPAGTAISDGNHKVEVISSNASEGTNGLIYNQASEPFSSGDVTTPLSLSLTQLGSQTLTIEINDIVYTSALSIFVKDETAPSMQSMELSSDKTTVTITYNEEIRNNGTTLTTNVQYDAAGQDSYAAVSGSTPTATVTISGSTLVVRFASALACTDGSINILANTIKDNAGNIQTSAESTFADAGGAIEAAYSATIAAYEVTGTTLSTTPTVGKDFMIRITAAKDGTNTNITDAAHPVIITGSVDGSLYSASPTFATQAVDIATVQVDTAGAQTLTVKINGLIYATINITAAADAGPILATSDPVSLDKTKKLVTITFDRVVTNLRSSLTDLKDYLRISTDNGTTYKALLKNDAVTLPTTTTMLITLESELTTATNKVKILANNFKDANNLNNAELVTAAFDATTTPAGATYVLTGIPFNLEISDIPDADGSLLTSTGSTGATANPALIITSDDTTEGTGGTVRASTQRYDFNSGTTNVPITLTKTGTQILSISVGGVVYATKTVIVGKGYSITTPAAVSNGSPATVTMTDVKAANDSLVPSGTTNLKVIAISDIDGILTLTDSEPTFTSDGATSIAFTPSNTATHTVTIMVNGVFHGIYKVTTS